MIDVYYSAERGDIMFEPVNVLKWAEQNNQSFLQDKTSRFNRCPAFTDFFKNTFAVSCPYDFSFRVIGDRLAPTTKSFEKTFYETNVVMRAARQVSIMPPGITCLADTDSLKMEMIPPVFNMKKQYDGFMIPGVYDVAKHCRTLELATHLYNDQEINIDEGDHLFYLRFLTNEKIRLRRFVMTDTIREIINSAMNYRLFTTRIMPLDYLYKKIKSGGIKKQLMKEIKNNAV